MFMTWSNSFSSTAQHSVCTLSLERECPLQSAISCNPQQGVPFGRLVEQSPTTQRTDDGLTGWRAPDTHSGHLLVEIWMGRVFFNGYWTLKGFRETTKRTIKKQKGRCARPAELVTLRVVNTSHVPAAQGQGGFRWTAGSSVHGLVDAAFGTSRQPLDTSWLKNSHPPDPREPGSGRQMWCAIASFLCLTLSRVRIGCCFFIIGLTLASRKVMCSVPCCSNSCRHSQRLRVWSSRTPCSGQSSRPLCGPRTSLRSVSHGIAQGAGQCLCLASSSPVTWVAVWPDFISLVEESALPPPAPVFVIARSTGTWAHCRSGLLLDGSWHRTCTQLRPHHPRWLPCSQLPALSRPVGGTLRDVATIQAQEVALPQWAASAVLTREIWCNGRSVVGLTRSRKSFGCMQNVRTVASLAQVGRREDPRVAVRDDLRTENSLCCSTCAACLNPSCSFLHFCDLLSGDDIRGRERRIVSDFEDLVGRKQKWEVWPVLFGMFGRSVVPCLVWGCSGFQVVGFRVGLN